MASRLARRHGLRLYSADTHTWDHVDRLIAAGSEAAARWNATSPPRDRFALHYERGPLVLEDLAALPDHPPVIAEGTVIPRPRIFLVDGTPHRTRSNATSISPAASAPTRSESR